MKKFAVLLFAVAMLFTAKLDTQAEVSWNTSGEKDPWGNDYSYKCWDGWGWEYHGGTIPQLIDISYDVVYDYEEAYKMLKYVNEERRKAGVPELIMKDELMDVAMFRAAECNMYFEHIRPSGADISSYSYLIYGENCGHGANARLATFCFARSEGHYENMIDPMYKYVGFGRANDVWVQVFCVEKIYQENGFDLKNPEKNKPVEWDKMTCGNRKNYTAEFTAKVNPKLYDNLIFSLDDNAFVEDYIELYDTDIGLKYTCRNKGDCIDPVLDVERYYGFSIADESVIKKEGKGFRCVGTGTTTVTVFLKDYPQLSATEKITVKEKPVKTGSRVTAGGHTYKVTSTKSKTVSFYNEKNGVQSVSVPNTVKIQGKTYKVISIAASAFKNNKKLTSVTVGSNVTSIGKNAFYGCTNLKKITVKSTKINSVGRNALKGIHNKAVIKVPKSKLTQYKRLFKGKGQSKTVKIKK